VTRGDIDGFRRRFADLGGATPGDAGDASLTATISREQLSSEYAPPEGTVQSAIANLWQEMLGVQSVGADDDFFELGGHSLLATQVVARLNERFGADLTLNQVLEAPTVRQLADRLDATAGADEEMDEFEI